MIRDRPEMKEIFPEPPVVSFRRPPNLKNKLVRANHSAKGKIQQPPCPSNTQSEWDTFMNNTGHIFNSKANIRLPIEGGNVTSSGVIYAIRCKKHDTISVGQTTTPLNTRLNRHWWDVQNRPDACEVSQHFANHSDCSFKHDIEVSILKTTTGPSNHMLMEEDKWIAKLDTKAPHGLNERLSPFGSLFYKLFN